MVNLVILLGIVVACDSRNFWNLFFICIVYFLKLYYYIIYIKFILSLYYGKL